MEFKPSTLKQREEFYRDFDIKDAELWFKKNSLPIPQIFAVDMGSETGIIKNKEKKGKIINLRPENLKEKLLKYLPEDVYYDRNSYKDPKKVLSKLNFRDIWSSDNLLGQQLTFDIDPENIKCECESKFPNFCGKCIAKVIDNALDLADFLKSNFKKIGFVYSGRGMHVHVFDKKAFNMSIEEREALSKEAKRFSIDPWVSRGYIRLMRLPYSLNALVSRIAIPLSLNEAKDFNPLTSEKTIPKFLKD